MFKKVYIDTSVFGGYFDSEFEKDTKPFFKKLFENEIKIIVSDILELEITEPLCLFKIFMNQSQKIYA